MSDLDRDTGLRRARAQGAHDRVAVPGRVAATEGYGRGGHGVTARTPGKVAASDALSESGIESNTAHELATKLELAERQLAPLEAALREPTEKAAGQAWFLSGLLDSITKLFERAEAQHDDAALALRPRFDRLRSVAQPLINAARASNGIDKVHDPALAANGPLSFTEPPPNSIAVETSSRQDPATKSIAELVKGVPVTSNDAPTDEGPKPLSNKTLAMYLETRSVDVWRALREYLYPATWPQVSIRLEWNEAMFNGFLVAALEHALGSLAEERLREVLHPHDLLGAIAPHVPSRPGKDLPGAVKLIIGQTFRAVLGPSVRRMTARYVDVADSMYAAAPTSAPVVRREQLITSHPMDRAVASALTSGGVRVAADADVLSGKRKVPRTTLRPIKLSFMGAADPALWNVVRAEPADASPEEVAASLFEYAKKNGEPTSYFAYGLASASPLHALPATWAIQFEEAKEHAPKAIKEGKLPDPATDSAASRLAVMASTDSSDAIALAQAGHDPKTSTMSSPQVAEVFDECLIQLGYLRQGLVPWELANHIIGETSYVSAKRTKLASVPQGQIGAWGSIALGQRERLYRIASGLRAVNDAATAMGITNKRSNSAAPLRGIVARYAEAAATSHLAATSEQILAEAQQLQAGLSLRSLQANIVELESAMEQGHVVSGSDKQMREQAAPYLQAKDEARQLEGKLLNGGEVSAEEFERVQLQAQELALQARLHTMQRQIDQLVGEWRAAGQGLIPTIVSTSKFNGIGPASMFIHTSIGEIYNDLNADAKRVKPVNDQSGGTLESAKLDARRIAVSRAQERFARLQQDRDLAHFFNAAYDAVKSQQLRTAIAHAALAIGIGIASAGVAGWVADGLVAAEGVEAVAQLSMGARMAITATEVTGNAVGQTVTSAGEAHATSFWGAMVDNAAFVLAPKMLGPASGDLQAAKAFEQMLNKQLATIEAQEARASLAMRTLAKTGRVLSWTTNHAGAITAHTVMGMAMGALVAKGHDLVNKKGPGQAAGGGPELTQDMIIQSASVAIGRLVHASIGERLSGLQQLSKRGDLAHAQQVHAQAVELYQLSAAAHPDANAALELLNRRSVVLEGELRLLDELAARESAHPTQGAPSSQEIAAMRADIHAQLSEARTQAMLDVKWHMLGLHELAPGVWSGTPEQLAAAIKEARASGHRVETAGDAAEITTKLVIDGKPVELHSHGATTSAVPESKTGNRQTGAHTAERTESKTGSPGGKQTGDVTVAPHPGVDVHNHFMGVASVEDFAGFMGRGPDGKGKPLTAEQMLTRMVEAVRRDSDYQAHYSKDKHDNQIFDFAGGGKGKKSGDAFENIKAIETAHAEIEALRKQPSTPELETKIREVAEDAVRRAMTASQDTPFDGAYSIRDTLIKTYIDPQVAGQPTKPYENYMRMTLEALARDGVLYSEQSQSVKKLTAGAFPREMVQRVLADFNAERAARGEPPLDVRFLAMIETRFLGEEGSASAGTNEAWQKQLGAARDLMKRPDVMGIDIAGPETTNMSAGGGQRSSRIRDLARMLREEGKKAGRKLVLRPHVGEGYVEMPVDPKTNRQKPFDRDDNAAHYKKAEQNMSALLRDISDMAKPGPNGEPPLYDPKNPDPEIRFGHCTHASPEIAAEMARLGVVAEVNLGSNAVSGSLQDNPQLPAGRDPNGRLQSFDDHSILSLAAEGTTILLNTDAQSVMNTSLQEEYDQARFILRTFRGDPAAGAAPMGKVRVTKEAYLAAHPRVNAATARGPFELGYNELPARMKRNIDDAYERMLSDAAARKQNVSHADAHDTRRTAPTAPKPGALQ